MSDPDPTDSAAVASHTLAYLRRMDRRMEVLEKTMVEIVEFFTRQATRIDRSDRATREGFERLERDSREVRSDLVLMENRILNRMDENLKAESRLRVHDERLEAIERAIGTPPPAM